ncbi:hypothetical protein PCANC_14184 [Puccinia coronata f. sp. avenae]|uniref:Uncharacterized protein n=1 Tax=Puccinia coronata f. sp. avenae TaxID=200324 RepID=A0A2N5UK87_9BASI|nr:hypothetical protein PCANC_14184 [Puccinia coronata f. sp. avenae]
MNAQSYHPSGSSTLQQCPLTLGLDSSFTALQTSYADLDFNTYNQSHYELAGYNPHEQLVYNQHGSIVNAGIPLASAQYGTNPPISFLPPSHMNYGHKTSSITGGLVPLHPGNHNNPSIPIPPSSQPTSSNCSTTPFVGNLSPSISQISAPLPPGLHQHNVSNPLVIPTASTAMPHAAPEPNTGLPSPLNSPCNNNHPPLKKKTRRSKIRPQLVEAARTKTLDEIMNLVGQDSKYS